MPDQFDINPITYKNGNSSLLRHRRVFESGGVVRYASDSELEVGSLTRTTHPNEHASVQPLYVPGQFKLIANGAIAKGGTAFRAADGKVGPVGTNVLGVAASAVSSDGDIVLVNISASAPAVITGNTRKNGRDDLGNVSGDVTIDFSTGNSDNKLINVEGDVTSWDLTPASLTIGDFDLYIRVDTQGFAIPKPALVKGDWLIVDQTGVTSHIPMTYDGSFLRISGVITTDQ